MCDSVQLLSGVEESGGVVGVAEDQYASPMADGGLDLLGSVGSREHRCSAAEQHHLLIRRPAGTRDHNLHTQIVRL